VSSVGPVGRVYVWVVLATALWGGTAVAGKLVLEHLPPLTTGALRYMGAALLLLIWSRRTLPDPRRLRPRDRWRLGAIGLLGTFLNHVCFFFALRWAPAAHGALIPPTTSPVWMMLLAARLEGDRLSRSQVVGLGLCLVGVVLVVRPERLAVGRPDVLVGDVLFLAGGMAWALYSQLSRTVMRRLSAPATLALGMVAGTPPLVLLALFEHPWRSLPAAPARAWLALAYLVVGATVLAFLWWNLALRRLGPSRTAAFSNLVPVFGVGAAWLVLGERLDGLQLAGGGLAVVGVLACQGRLGPMLATLRGQPDGARPVRLGGRPPRAEESGRDPHA
jgi:drug/metabolite transporter (DMT)-like permease